MQEVVWGEESQCIVCKGGQRELTSLAKAWRMRLVVVCGSTEQLEHAAMAPTPSTYRQFLFLFFFLFWTVFLRVIIALPSEPWKSSCDGESLRLKRRELQDLSGRCRLARVTPWWGQVHSRP